MSDHAVSEIMVGLTCMGLMVLVGFIAWLAARD